MNNFRLYSNERFFPFWGIGAQGSTGVTGSIGAQGDTGATGATGAQGYLSGIDYYLNYSQTADITGNRYMKRIPSLLAEATASTGVSNSEEKQLNFTSNVS